MRARVLCERRRLQRVLKLRDGLAAVGTGAELVEKMPDVGNRE
jgi:hypothetical protein